MTTLHPAFVGFGETPPDGLYIYQYKKHYYSKPAIKVSKEPPTAETILAKLDINPIELAYNFPVTLGYMDRIHKRLSYIADERETTGTTLRSWLIPLDTKTQISTAVLAMALSRYFGFGYHISDDSPLIEKIEEVLPESLKGVIGDIFIPVVPNNIGNYLTTLPLDDKTDEMVIQEFLKANPELYDRTKAYMRGFKGIYRSLNPIYKLIMSGNGAPQGYKWENNELGNPELVSIF